MHWTLSACAVSVSVSLMTKKSTWQLCGLDLDTMLYLKEHTGIAMAELEALFLFLRVGLIDIVSFIVTTKHGRGWACPDKCMAKIKATARHLSDHLESHVRFRYEVLANELNTTYGILPPAVQVAYDVVPLALDGSPAMYAGKYRASVGKVLVATSLTGFAVFVSRVFTGSTADAIVQESCGIEDCLRDAGVVALADGGFTRTANTIVPPSLPQIWPARLDPGQTYEQYYQGGHLALMEVEKIAHFRARAEHIFARDEWGRWKAFGEWRGTDAEFLDDAVFVSFGALNVEQFRRNGFRGRYAAYSEAKVEEVRAKIERHPTASSRYPPPEVPPLRAARRARQLRQPDDPDEAVAVPAGVDAELFA
jgi:hypothetical protein